jgi:hypothetical protein
VKSAYGGVHRFDVPFVVLFYLNLPPPSPLVHPDNILRRSIIEPLAASGYVSHDEFDRLIASAPRYIVTDVHGCMPRGISGAAKDRFRHLLVRRYAVFRRSGDTTVYKRFR